MTKTNRFAPRFAVVTFALAGSLIGSSAAMAQLTITNPDSASIDAPSASTSTRQTPVFPASYRAPSRIRTFTDEAAAHQDEQSLAQIRVKVQYLMVDSATRVAMYRKIDRDKIRHIGSGTRILVPESPVNPIGTADSADANSSSIQMQCPSAATTCVLSGKEVDAMIDRVTQAEASAVKPVPSIMLLDGKDAEMNDLSQRPFIIDMHGPDDNRKPTVEVFDEGTRVHIQAAIVHGAAEPEITVSAHVVCSRIVDLVDESVFGLGEDAATIAMPQHMSKTTHSSETLATGSVLMIDPHFQTPAKILSEVPVPMVSKIPYLGQNFKSVQEVEVQQYLIVLLQPSVVTP
ncbi:hypothetical protein [Rubripirellula reticaptiva]|uniref:Bacterial type II and III secretion system protein n=1 Tax=Rubripirellula reticaptiva TaxID=2528013 RepID=A0A5C6EJY9_9BACT|nr:hypothetical protein [Rubripirellula reticaptiva]TWU49372.1 Bacterial type II and III secretion system protein [Rubripirellula reticaptiva]